MKLNDEKIESAKQMGGNLLSKIKKLRNTMTNLEDSGGKIVAIAQWCLNVSFYLALVLFVVWTFAGIRVCMVYHWGGYYSSGYYSFSLVRYLLGFLAIILFYALEYMACLWMKSYGELVNNTKVMADDCKIKNIPIVSQQELIDERINALVEETF